MIAVTTFRNKAVLVFGLGGSGLATAEALAAGGARVLACDDNAVRMEAAAAAGIATADFRNIDFSKFDALVLSPGVPLTHPAPHWTVEMAQAAGIEIIGDVELFNRERLAHAPDCPFIAITGTNGKSTTTALIAHILETADRDVQLGGNIGRAVLTLDPPVAGRHYVIECSSYQIDLAPGLKPSVGLHINLAPDHLDRHGTLAHYAAIKARLVRGADHAVVGVDDALSRAIAAERAEAGRSLDRVSVMMAADIAFDGTILLDHGKAALDMAGIASLRGRHNLQNAAMAYAACRAVGLSNPVIEAGMRSFPGLAHRMEQVGEKNGILFINDSKATNADAAARALDSFDIIYWILGGRAKQGGIAELNEFFPKIVHAFLIGEASEQFAHDLEGKVAVSKCETLDRATEAALRMALNGKHAKGQTTAVLLSPACASFDQFANFEARGNAFRTAVQGLLTKG